MCALNSKIFSPLFRENLRVAVKSIKANRLRSVLTMLIIAIGITSLVGVLTATDALRHEVFSSYEKMGMTSFYIGPRRVVASTSEHKRIRNSNSIPYFQARSFKQNFNEGCAVGYGNTASSSAACLDIINLAEFA